MLSYSKITHKKTTVKLNPDTIFYTDMRHILGFNESNMSSSKEADSVVDVAHGFFSLYVYSSFVDLEPSATALCRCCASSR